MFSSCFGLGSHRRRTAEEEPLLPQYDDDTSRQRRLHQKLHTYQMLRALARGFMPSNEQAIVNLRTLLAADLLNPNHGRDHHLSDSGQALVHYTRQWLGQLVELLEHKNAGDQIQDFLWYLSQARINVDMEDIAERASKAKAKADTVAVYSGLRTVGSLLLTNSDFRLFLGDLDVVTREVFKDTAFALSRASQEAGERLEPSTDEQAAAKGNGLPKTPTAQDLADQTEEVSDVLNTAASTVANETGESVLQRLDGAEGDTMARRLQHAVVNLRQRRDYSDSVSTLSLLFKRYAMAYSRVIRDTVDTAEEDVNRNPETDRALRNLWMFVRSFGEAKEWEELERRAQAVVEHSRDDPEFEDLVGKLGDAFQEMFTDPAFFDHAEERFQELRDKSKALSSHSSLRDDVDGLLSQLQSTFNSMLRDQDVAKLIKTSITISRILSPKHHYANTELLEDSINVFAPLVIQAVNYIPIPRVEVSTPHVDLLLENLVLEPGITINHTSFFPYKLRVETLNDIEIRKARFRTTSAMRTLMRVRIDGLSIRGEDIGFWLRAHSGLLRVADEGIASFALDERGLDIQLDIEVGRDRLEKILTLRAVKVHIHKLNWTLRRSKFSLFAWLLKPLLTPLIRITLESKIASALADALHFANRELIYARERLRATRIADPDDLKTFFQAVLARLTPADDPDLYTRIGVDEPGRGTTGGDVFEGVYAPGSIVKVWREEAARAPQRIREGEEEGWRNAVFDVQTVPM
ncbi:uncharacterized protein C8A04DRAFT_11636 [Dichotomopilus funicola]|uniref:HAM1-like N-terminal domain-containing protein n=1 Tax=Dichotomopilus funicola TaxID=1934379 RepID=A0AAN6V4J9_9PEZI|nr:hypothetical protein C8A04DRAFT_11636 [Dichotomopilus funicola]